MASRARGRLILFLALLLTVPSVAAHAAEISTTCAGLQAALDAANDGDVITITDATCTATSYTMKTGTEITLQGAPGTGTTFNGGTPPTTRILSGFNVGGSIFRNLNFVSGASNLDGGGVAVTGTVFPTFDTVGFLNNTGRDGGGLFVSSTATSGTIRITTSLFEGNVANDSGGGLAINTSQAPNVDVVIESTTFSGNSAFEWGGGAFTNTHDLRLENNAFNDNTAGGKGGGAYVLVRGADADLINNGFVSNQIDPEASLASAGFYGGGLWMGAWPGSQITQFRNVFDANEISVATSAEGYGAAGEYVTQVNPNGPGPAVQVFLNRDRFTNNVVNDPGDPTFLVRGGGFGVGIVIPIANALEVLAWNTVAAGNQVLGGVSRGSGMYAGAVGGGGNNLTLINSTISGNTAVSGTAGVGGGAGDSLISRNSIVAGNTGTTPDIFGFGEVTVQFTNSCTGPGFTGAPWPGPGNICANPLLVNPGPGVADVHQTAASPTRDAGSNELVPPPMTTDYEGDPRIMDSNADGTAVVDMGADERLQPLIVQPQPETQPQPPAPPPLQQAVARRGRIPATGPEDLLPQSLAAFSYVLLGILLLLVTTPKWQAAWRATSYAARHSGRRRARYVPKHRGGRR